MAEIQKRPVGRPKGSTTKKANLSKGGGVYLTNLEKQIDDLEKQIAVAEKVKTEEKDKKKAEDSAFEIIKNMLLKIARV